MKCLWLAVSPGVWVSVNTSASHNSHTSPEQTSTVLQLIWVLIVVGVFIKFTVQTLKAQLSEKFTDHQRVGEILFCLITWFSFWFCFKSNGFVLFVIY